MSLSAPSSVRMGSITRMGPRAEDVGDAVGVARVRGRAAHVEGPVLVVGADENALSVGEHDVDVA